jgi:3D (Asp-Asp-Asp) domain-containing protein
MALGLSGSLVLGCAQQSSLSHSSTAGANLGRRHHVRTTAYTLAEGAGHRNAIGVRCSGNHVTSAASDWSHYPLGTRFRIVGNQQEYVIDDYGPALIGTDTIDLYKPTGLAMQQWGVRHVDIDVLQWGSTEQSLKILRPRNKHSTVRRMILALEQNAASGPPRLD